MPDWPTDRIGERVVIAPSDHPHAGKQGVIVRFEDCQVCGKLGKYTPEVACGYLDAIIRLDDGTETRLYEPEAMPVGYLDEAEVERGKAAE